MPAAEPMQNPAAAVSTTRKVMRGFVSSAYAESLPNADKLGSAAIISANDSIILTRSSASRRTKTARRNSVDGFLLLGDQHLITPQREHNHRGKRQGSDNKVCDSNRYHRLERLRICLRSKPRKISGNPKAELNDQQRSSQSCRAS